MRAARRVREAGTYARVYAVVGRIPAGRVATYGQVAALAGLGGHARQVGYALHALAAESGVPWHRVINARGELSLGPGTAGEALQRRLLAREGVRFDPRGRIDLGRYRWNARSKRTAPAAPARAPRQDRRG
jgi:methylated-DNA-protein-cysteine methyltransferase-like protein